MKTFMVDKDKVEAAGVFAAIRAVAVDAKLAMTELANRVKDDKAILVTVELIEVEKKKERKPKKGKKANVARGKKKADAGKGAVDDDSKQDGNDATLQNDDVAGTTEEVEEDQGADLDLEPAEDPFKDTDKQ